MSDDDRPLEPRPDDDSPSNPGDSGLPAEITDVLRRLMGGRDVPPEMLQQLEGLGLGNLPPGQFGAMMQQVQALFNAPDQGPLSGRVATDVARQAVAEAGDPTMTDRERALAADAGRVADLWLGAVTDLESPGLRGEAWSRSEWIEATMPVWQRIVAPVAEGVSNALAKAMIDQLGDGGLEQLPEGLIPPGTNPAVVMQQMGPMMARIGSSMFSMQLGQGLGVLATDTLTGTEVALPLTADDILALIPANVAAFGEGLDIDVEQVWLYLAVREGARQRLFAGTPWLGPQLLAAVEDYARGIAIDTTAIDAAVREVEMTDPAALQQTLTDKLFSPAPTPAQAAALRRLETWLALIEGWVDVVAEQASGAHLPQAAALGETVRRRRASGGPAEKTFAGLVGLELRPRRLRDAANLFRALESAGGTELRDSAWGHPDVAPTVADLDDVLGYVERRTGRPEGDAMDAALADLLREESS